MKVYLAQSVCIECYLNNAIYRSISYFQSICASYTINLKCDQLSRIENAFLYLLIIMHY